MHSERCGQLGHELPLPRALLQQICLSSLQKGLSHEISRSLVEKLAPLYVCLPRALLLYSNTSVKPKKGLSHKISHIFKRTTRTMIGVASWDTSSLSPQGSTQANLPFKHKKEQSHEIYQIFRPTTCTLIGVASWEPSSLSPQCSTEANLPSKLKKGLSHEISRIFR